MLSWQHPLEDPILTLRQALTEAQRQISGRPGIFGVGMTRTEFRSGTTGANAIGVYGRPEALAKVPAQIGGWPVIRSRQDGPAVPYRAARMPRCPTLGAEPVSEIQGSAAMPKVKVESSMGWGWVGVFTLAVIGTMAVVVSAPLPGDPPEAR